VNSIHYDTKVTKTRPEKRFSVLSSFVFFVLLVVKARTRIA
jgi:hypothetical protein